MVRRTLQVILLLAVGGVLPGCASLAIAGGFIAYSEIHQEIKRREYAREVERKRQEQLRFEAERRARIERERLARRQAEELRRHRILKERRRREADRRERERLAALPAKAERHSSDLADVRRELGQIAETAVDTRKELLRARITRPGGASARKEKSNGNQ